MIRLALPVFIVAASAASLVSAKGGHHYGWCNGAGNPHRGASCGGSSPSTSPSVPVVKPSQVPTANPLPPKPTPSLPTPTVTPVFVPSIAPNAIPGQVPVLAPPMVPQPVPQPVPTAIPQQIPTPMQVPGQVPVLAPPMVPQPVPQPVPTAIPQQIPTPMQVPGQVPVLAPPMVPQPVPQPVPTAIPQQIPTPMQVPGLVLPRPKVKPPINPKPFVSTGVIPNPVQTGQTQIGQVRPPIVTPPQRAQVVVPPMVPMLVPQRVPQAIPQPIPQRVPNLAPKITHRPQVRSVGIGRELITVTPGRQPLHNPPAFQGKAQGETWNCVASGHGKRKSVEDGKVVSNGVLRHVGSVDVLGQDLPALHPRHAHCIVSVKRRKR